MIISYKDLQRVAAMGQSLATYMPDSQLIEMQKATADLQHLAAIRLIDIQKTAIDVEYMTTHFQNVIDASITSFRGTIDANIQSAALSMAHSLRPIGASMYKVYADACSFAFHALQIVREFEQQYGVIAEEVQAFFRRTARQNNMRSEYLIAAKEMYDRLLLYIASKIVRNPEDADDVLQDTYEKAWRFLQASPQEEIDELKIKPWLCNIAYRTALNLKRQQRWFVPLEGAWLLQQPAGRFDQPEMSLMRNEVIDMLDTALQTLSPIQRSIILLRFLAEEYSLAEIAESLSCPYGTVKSHLHRGLRALRKQLNKQGVETDIIEVMIDTITPVHYCTEPQGAQE